MKENNKINKYKVVLNDLIGNLKQTESHFETQNWHQKNITKIKL